MVFEVLEANIDQDENGVISIGFFQNDNYDNYLIIQFVDDLDEQDEKLGFTKYYVELKERGGAYNCLEKVIVEQNSLLFILNNKGVETFKEENIKIDLSNLAFQQWVTIKNMLPKVFSEVVLVS